MAINNPLKYSDFIQPDDAILNLINQLEQAMSAHSQAIKQLQTDIQKPAAGIKNATSATLEGQEAIKSYAVTIDQLTKENEKLRASQSNNGIELKKLKILQTEQNKLTKLSTQLNESKEGSYNKLSAQYSLNKIKLNQMTKAERDNTQQGQLLEQQTREIYTEMSRLQEVTGKHTLSVGNYAKANYGLNTSVNQLTRELPVLGMNLNTFFLAISNNIPMFVDEISKISKANKELIKSQKSVIPVGRQVVKAILSWQTALSVGVALLTIYGKDLIEFIGSIVKGTKAIDAQVEAQKALNEARDEGTTNAQSELVELKLLYSAATDEARSKDERVEATRRLKDEWPEQFDNMSDEVIMLGRAEKAYDGLTKSILDAAIARAAQEKITETMKKIFDEQEKLATRSTLFMQAATVGGPLGALMNFFGGKRADGSISKIAAFQAQIESLMDSIDFRDLFFGDDEEGAGGVEAQVNRLLDLQRRYVEATLNIREDGALKEALIVQNGYDNQIEDLKAMTDLSAEEEKERTKLIIALTNLRNKEMLDIFNKYEEKRIKDQEKADAALIKQKEKAYKEEVDIIDQLYEYETAQIDASDDLEIEKTRKRLEAELKRWEAILKLNQEGYAMLTGLEIESIRAYMKTIKNEMDSLGEGGETDIYSLLGLKLDNDSKKAIDQALKYTLDNLGEYLDKRLEISEKLVKASQEEVSAAKDALQAEIEARNQGYAFNVSDAQRRLALAKEAEQKALAEKAKLLKKQQALQAIEQAGNLITATTKLLELSPILAIPLIAGMWGTFAAAKIQAFKVTEPVQSYGEGGYEVLEGGSHASGNDISIGHTKDGKSRRAEGGEAMAIINKRKTRKYKKILPGVIDSLNKGTFEHKYLGAYDMGRVGTGGSQSSSDLKLLEGDVHAIRRQGERVYFTDGRGRMVEKYKNLTTIKHVN